MADKCEEGKTEGEEEEGGWLGDFDDDIVGRVFQTLCKHGADAVRVEFQNVAVALIGHEEIATAVEGKTDWIVHEICTSKDGTLPA